MKHVVIVDLHIDIYQIMRIDRNVFREIAIIHEICFFLLTLVELLTIIV